MRTRNLKSINNIVIPREKKQTLELQNVCPVECSNCREQIIPFCATLQSTNPNLSHAVYELPHGLEMIKVSAVVENVFKLHYFKDTSSVLPPEESLLEEIPLCPSCANVLSHLCNYFKEFMRVQRLGSYLSHQLLRLDGIIRDSLAKIPFPCNNNTNNDSSSTTTTNNFLMDISLSHIPDTSSLLEAELAFENQVELEELIDVGPMNGEDNSISQVTWDLLTSINETENSSSTSDILNVLPPTPLHLDSNGVGKIIGVDEDTFDIPLEVFSMPEFCQYQTGNDFSSAVTHDNQRALSQASSEHASHPPPNPSLRFNSNKHIELETDKNYDYRINEQNSDSSNTTPPPPPPQPEDETLEEESRDKAPVIAVIAPRRGRKVGQDGKKKKPGFHETFHRRKMEHPFPCVYCPIDFDTEIDRVEHLKASHCSPSKSIICSKCGKVFANQNCKHKHKPKCGRVPAKYHLPPFICKTCGREFESFTLQTVHERHAHATARPHACDQCNYTGKTVGSLLSHKKHVHAITAKAICEECNQVLKSPWALDYHIKRMHTPDGNLRYQEQNRKVAEKRKGLSNNTSGSKDKPESTVCSDCKIDFQTIHRLLRHRLKEHETESKFQCEQCGKGFVKRRSFWKHRKTVHDESRPYVCEKCGSSFKVLNSLTTHFSRVHSEEGRLKYNEYNRVSYRHKRNIEAMLTTQNLGMNK